MLFRSIATGAPMPTGADAVVMVEETEVRAAAKVQRAEAAAVQFNAAAKAGQNIGRRGADIGIGMNVVSTGDVLTPSRIGALAATGHRSVEVFARPSVAILSTGNEVIEPGHPLPPGHIYDVNRYTLESIVRQHGGVARALPPCGDSLDDLLNALDAASSSELIVFKIGRAHV